MNERVRVPMGSMRFEAERELFRRFKYELTQRPQVLAQMEQAIEQVYWTYDTTIRENRFTVGGVVEFILGAALSACGVPVRHKGVIESDIDLMLADGTHGYSVKAIFKGSGTRLVNTMGAGADVTRWKSATLFLVTGLGIVYADPELPWWAANLDRCIRPSGDAITPGKKCITEFAEAHPEWLIKGRMPTETDRPQRPHRARTHAADLAAQVLMHYPQLFEQFAALRPGEEIPGRLG